MERCDYECARILLLIVYLLSTSENVNTRYHGLGNPSKRSVHYRLGQGMRWRKRIGIVSFQLSNIHDRAYSFHNTLFAPIWSDTKGSAFAYVLARLDSKGLQCIIFVMRLRVEWERALRVRCVKIFSFAYAIEIRGGGDRIKKRKNRKVVCLLWTRDIRCQSIYRNLTTRDADVESSGREMQNACFFFLLSLGFPL